MLDNFCLGNNGMNSKITDFCENVGWCKGLIMEMVSVQCYA